MKTFVSSTIALMLGSAVLGAQDDAAFPAYVDSDICAHLMLGPITPQRIGCSTQTHHDGDSPVLVDLRDNTVLEVSKPKMVNELVGQLAEITGTVKHNHGTIKISSAKPLAADAIPKDDPAHRLLDKGAAQIAPDPRVHELIRHQLAMMPYITDFDFISFTMLGEDVTLTGWTVRATNRNTAENLVKRIEGVGRVVNNIEILPVGATDNQIRAAARAQLQQTMSRYFWGSGSDIKIIVKNGNIILLGTVLNQGDSDLASIRCNSVPFAFHVFNMLRVKQGG